MEDGIGGVVRVGLLGRLELVELQDVVDERLLVCCGGPSGQVAGA